MKIAATTEGTSLDAEVSPVFGRCPTFLFVDTDTLESKGVANPAIHASGGAGIQAAQFVVDQGAEAVVTGNVGPNAFGVLQAAQLPAYLVQSGSVRDAVDAHQAGRLQRLVQASAESHAGTRAIGRRSGGGQGRS